MKYDFISILDRAGKDALAADVIPVDGAFVEECFSRIPMWVADMNFATAPSVTAALEERIKNPTYGYFVPRKEYFSSIIRWQETHNEVIGLEEKHIGYENGVLGCLASALAAFTAPGDKILVHSPTYIGFTGTVERAGRKLLHSELSRDENGIWRMDYEDMEQKLRDEHVHFAIFCTPHNPTGRVWEKEEVERAFELYRKYNCVVFSDEIWSDLLLDGRTHIPPQSISEDARHRTIACYAPSKTFSLAGLVGSYHIIYDDLLRDRLDAAAAMSHYNSMNVLSMHALIGAYSKEGSEWVEELNHVLSKNAAYACDFIENNFPGVTLARPQGTYMLYLDCEGYCKSRGISLDELLKAGIRVGVIWHDGRPFHRPYAIRMNLALPTSMVQEAFCRLKEHVFL